MQLYKKSILAALGIVIISLTWMFFNSSKNDKTTDELNNLDIKSEKYLPEKSFTKIKAFPPISTKAIETDSQLRRKISINPIAFGEALSALDLPISTGERDTEKEARELTILADLYPDELLIQFFTAVSCTSEKFQFCNIELYVDRIRQLDPNNALADKFLFIHHLDNQDMGSALAVLENIKADAYYDSYFPDTANEIYRQINSGEWASDQISELDVSQPAYAVGISAMKIPRPMVIATCAKQLKNSIQKERWLAACNHFGKVLDTSKDMLSRSLGLSLQRMYFESRDQLSVLQIIDQQQRQLDELQRELGRLSDTDFFNHPENIVVWLQDLKDYGEIIAAQRYIERYKKNN